MSLPSRDHKQYHSAHRRLLQATVADFFATQFPKFFGPAIRERIAEELLTLIDRQCPTTATVRPGQCVWNAVAIDTRADSDRLRLVPVIVTLVADTDITRLAAGESTVAVRQDAIARVLEEAYRQGALLSMRDLGLLTWHSPELITAARQAWETAHARTLPHPGTLQDMGSCVTHKTAIVVKAVYEQKDPRQVAQETHHTQQAVDRYLRDFHRVRTCVHKHLAPTVIPHVTGMSAHLVNEYLQIIQTYEGPPSSPPSGADAILPPV